MRHEPSEIIHPTCMTCRVPMWLEKVELGEIADRQHFGCKVCDQELIRTMAVAASRCQPCAPDLRLHILSRLNRAHCSQYFVRRSSAYAFPWSPCASFWISRPGGSSPRVPTRRRPCQIWSASASSKRSAKAIAAASFRRFYER
jgi:hypothetical protein